MQRDYYGNNQNGDVLVEADYEPMAPRSQPRAKPPKLRKELPFFSKHYRKIFVVAFVLILISILLTASTQYPEGPEWEDYDEEDDNAFEQFEEDVETFDDVIRVLTVTANLFFAWGVLLMCFTMILGAFADRNIPDGARIVMLILAVVIIVIFFSAGFKFSTAFG